MGSRLTSSGAELVLVKTRSHFTYSGLSDVSKWHCRSPVNGTNTARIGFLPLQPDTSTQVAQESQKRAMLNGEHCCWKVMLPAKALLKIIVLHVSDICRREIVVSQTTHHQELCHPPAQKRETGATFSKRIQKCQKHCFIARLFRFLYHCVETKSKFRWKDKFVKMVYMQWESWTPKKKRTAFLHNLTSLCEVNLQDVEFSYSIWHFVHRKILMVCHFDFQKSPPFKWLWIYWYIHLGRHLWPDGTCDSFLSCVFVTQEKKKQTTLFGSQPDTWLNGMWHSSLAGGDTCIWVGFPLWATCVTAWYEHVHWYTLWNTSGVWTL